MQDKIVGNIFDFEDEAIKLLNPQIGFESVTGKIINFNDEVAEVLLHSGQVGRLFITEFYSNKKFKLGENYTYLKLSNDEKPLLSVAHPNLLVSIISGLSPEFRKGVIREFGVVRRVGIRSKIAVGSTVENFDPVGAVVGKAANRIKYLIDKLGGERVDVVPYHQDKKVFVANSLGVKVQNIELINGEYVVEVPVHQMQAAIGGGGINVLLAAKLTNSKIKIQGAINEK